MKTQYQNLLVWQKSVILVKSAYMLTSYFPKTELYSLVDQIKRAATSIPANIAEWSLRNTIKEDINFLYIALGSAAELESHMLIAQELGFIQESDSHEFFIQINEILKMLSGLINSKKIKSQSL